MLCVDSRIGIVLWLVILSLMCQCFLIFSKAENVFTYSVPVIFQVKKRCVKSFFCKSGQINLIIGGVFTEQSWRRKNRNTRIDVYLLFECCFATVNGKLIVQGQADRAAEDGGGEESSQVRLIHVILSLLWKCTKNTMCGGSETLRSGSHFPF